MAGSKSVYVHNVDANRPSACLDLRQTSIGSDQQNPNPQPTSAPENRTLLNFLPCLLVCLVQLGPLGMHGLLGLLGLLKLAGLAGLVQRAVLGFVLLLVL